MRTLRAKLCNAFLNMGEGAPQYDILVTPEAKPLFLPGKKLATGPELSWLTILRRGTTEQGEMDWPTFLYKGRQCFPENARIQQEAIILKKTGLIEWSQEAHEAKTKSFKDRFLSKKTNDGAY